MMSSAAKRSVRTLLTRRWLRTRRRGVWYTWTVLVAALSFPFMLAYTYNPAMVSLLREEVRGDLGDALRGAVWQLNQTDLQNGAFILDNTNADQEAVAVFRANWHDDPLLQSASVTVEWGILPQFGAGTNPVLLGSTKLGSSPPPAAAPIGTFLHPMLEAAATISWPSLLGTTDTFTIYAHQALLLGTSPMASATSLAPMLYKNGTPDTLVSLFRAAFPTGEAMTLPRPLPNETSSGISVPIVSGIPAILDVQTNNAGPYQLTVTEGVYSPPVQTGALHVGDNLLSIPIPVDQTTPGTRIAWMLSHTDAATHQIVTISNQDLQVEASWMDALLAGRNG